MQTSSKRKKQSIYNDPSFLARIIGGKYLTRDQNDIWVTNYDKDGMLSFCLNFEKSIKISMIRVWNYNKSRIHSTRGVRHIGIKFDEKLIFFGEVQKASGGDIRDIEKLAEYIVFTDNPIIFEEIEKNDWITENYSNMNFFTSIESNPPNINFQYTEKRPRICSEHYTSSTDNQPVNNKIRKDSFDPIQDNERPHTANKMSTENMAFIGSSIRKLMVYGNSKEPSTSKINISGNEEYHTPNGAKARTKIMFPNNKLNSGLNFQNNYINSETNLNSNNTCNKCYQFSPRNKDQFVSTENLEII